MMTAEKIVVGRIVAKLRNSVPVCLLENGVEVKRYNNIEFPDELKTLEAVAFGFDIGANDKITFQLCFDAEVLPTEFPAKRKSVSRVERAAAKTAATSAAEATATPEAIEAAPVYEPPALTSYTEARYNVTGDQRKALVEAIGEITGCKPVYQGAPTFAYVSGDVRIDKTGTLTGEIPQSLIGALADRLFTAEEVA